MRAAYTELSYTCVLRSFTDAFATLCTVCAPLDDVPKRVEHGKNGPYFESSIDIVLSFGLTEFKAELAWIDGVCLFAYDA